MLSSTQIKGIVAEARPIIERMLDDAELIAGFRTLVAEQGGDWSALKALLKAQIQDERDESANGKRVQKIVEKAEFASAYADMLGLGNMNKEKYIVPSFVAFTSDGDEYHYDAETGEVTDTSFLGPHSQEVDDGRPHPSSNAGGAKNDGAQTIVGRADDRSDLSITQLEQQDASVSQDRNEPISDGGATVTHSNTTLATPDASCKAGEGILLPLSPAANPDDDVPDFLKRGAA